MVIGNGDGGSSGGSVYSDLVVYNRILNPEVVFSLLLYWYILYSLCWRFYNNGCTHGDSVS